MHADIYNPELWNSFFLMVGGGVAAITGLIFVALSVAMSLNLESWRIFKSFPPSRFFSNDKIFGLTLNTLRISPTRA